MEAFKKVLGHDDKMLALYDALLDAENRIRAIEGVSGVEITPNENSAYRAHIRLKPCADQVSVLTDAHSIVKESGVITGIRLWRGQFPINLDGLKPNFQTTAF